MAEAAPAAAATDAKADASSAKKGGKKKLILILLPVLLLGGGGAAAFLVPSIHAMIPGLGGGGGAKKVEVAESAQPFFVEVPEMTVTMPNNGRPRQLRIKLALELAKHPAAGGPEEKAEKPEALSPRIQDGLVLYLRTLRDTEVDGALSIDRMRGDLQRRLDLLMGEGVLKDVLITSMVIG